MNGEHVDEATLNRLFSGRGGGPLDAHQFDALHRHLEGCDDCRARFQRQSDDNRREGEVLTRGQADTILNVVLQKGWAAEEAAAARAASPAEAAQAPAPLEPRRRLWARPWAWGIGGAVAAACAALLLFPGSGPPSGTWQERGAAEGVPAPDLFCDDEVKHVSVPLTDRVSVCPVGRRVSVQAAAIGDLDRVSVVACHPASGCRLVDSVDRRGRPSVSVFGPRMEYSGRWTIFTIWSAAPLAQVDVDVAVAEVLSRGGTPNGVDALPLRQPNRQIAATVAAGARSP